MNFTNIYTREFVILLFHGAILTALAFLLCLWISLSLGVLFTYLRMSTTRSLSFSASCLVQIFRGIPSLFWILFLYFALPDLTKVFSLLAKNYIYLYGFICGTIGLSVNSASHISDILKSSIECVPKNLAEVAEICGLTDKQIWINIVLPHALHYAYPTLGNRILHIAKATSLFMIIGIKEFTWSTQQIESETFLSVESNFLALVFYIIFVMFVGWLYKISFFRRSIKVFEI